MRHLKPPNLKNENLSRLVTAYRPHRRESIRQDAISLNGKLVVNNYGHGSNGWSVAPGCASHAISLLEKNSVSKNDPITVAGAGAVGLVQAFELVNSSYKNITIISKSYKDLTSHQAGGIFDTGDLPIKTKFQHEIITNSHKYWMNIYNGHHQILGKDCVRILTSYSDIRKEWYEPFVGEIFNHPKELVLNFGNRLLKKVWAYDDFVFMNTIKIMKDITLALQKNGVKFIEKEIQNFDEISDKVVMNCMAQGAKPLLNDDKVSNIQGHLIILKNSGYTGDYMIYGVNFDSGKTPEGHTIKRQLYLLPKEDGIELGVLGGTFIENSKDTDKNSQEFDIVAQNARSWFNQ